MVSVRPYRTPLSHIEAIAELQRVRGSELAPRCVEALLGAFADEEQAAA